MVEVRKPGVGVHGFLKVTVGKQGKIDYVIQIKHVQEASAGLCSTMSASPFSSAHRLYVKSLYKRMLKNELDWVIRYDHFRPRALAVRAQFEANR
jgi:hypothetical protein